MHGIENPREKHLTGNCVAYGRKNYIRTDSALELVAFA
jgi:hypothetical protein